MYRLLPHRLREAAASKGDHTGYAIAKRTGLAESTISRLLSGQQQPGVNTLLRLSRAYGVSTDDLMEHDEPTEAAA